ncbi:hypothetical protein GCM10025876_17010 [Demequina litorisediminis]|uniref:Uncharacterized protein n=1 Tax=Demequina litorisediminis TaxID=1849022 RepID=A0ABQ6IFH5_9MICO|nr:hypothetical protein GCM10025876_17010 [Demequina litorisediminis]
MRSRESHVAGERYVDPGRVGLGPAPQVKGGAASDETVWRHPLRHRFEALTQIRGVLAVGVNAGREANCEPESDGLIQGAAAPLRLEPRRGATGVPNDGGPR